MIVDVIVANLEDGGRGNQETRNVVAVDIRIALIADDDLINLFIRRTELSYFLKPEIHSNTSLFFFCLTLWVLNFFLPNKIWWNMV